ncbi:hypothetical protein BV25DRAFT_1921660 [Artomyces pyxidatus]|uniref:Uncharacterized protein n=1 Tax=Artomyces pyxidatus TaxID=48021 RepID=A0ACB8SGH0_9AGAM|nr:hypothetical protein BV25DRAFT_1921660 [Artomyces pyxidatus]
MSSPPPGPDTVADTVTAVPGVGLSNRMSSLRVRAQRASRARSSARLPPIPQTLSSSARITSGGSLFTAQTTARYWYIKYGNLKAKLHAREGENRGLVKQVDHFKRRAAMLRQAVLDADEDAAKMRAGLKSMNIDAREVMERGEQEMADGMVEEMSGEEMDTVACDEAEQGDWVPGYSSPEEEEDERT